MLSNSSNNHEVDHGLRYILLFRLIVWGYVGLVLSIFGIAGNLITILVLMSSSLRTISTNIYLIALSCSNILFLLIFIPSYSIRYLLGYSLYLSNQPPFAFEIVLSRLPTTPIYNTILLSIIYLTIAVSIDRLILVKFPLKSKHILTKRATLTTILSIYIFSFIYCIPYWLEQHYVPEVKQCRLTNIGKKINKYIRIYLYIPVVYVIPFITLTCINITIIMNLIAKKRQRQTLFGKSNKKISADYHITLMLVTIIIVFVLCQLPLLVLNVWNAIDHHGSFENLAFHTLNSIGILLTVFNTSTNFLLYCFFGRKFRLTLFQYIWNIFSKHTKSSNLSRQSLSTNKLHLKRFNKRTSSNKFTVETSNSNALKITHHKSDQQILTELTSVLDPGLTASYRDESSPLLATNIYNKNSTEKKLDMKENSSSTFNDNQTVVLINQ